MRKTIFIKKSLLKETISQVVRQVLSEGRHKTYNVNMSYPLSKPHRKVKVIPTEALKDKLANLWYKANNLYKENKNAPNDIKKLFQDLVKFARGGVNSKLTKFNGDIEKVLFDWENCYSIGDIREYKGIKYLIFEIGGDWEAPVAVFVYFDGENLRCYIPIHGNAINLKGGNNKNKKIAFGNNDDADADFCRSEGIKKHMHCKRLCSI